MSVHLSVPAASSRDPGQSPTWFQPPTQASQGPHWQPSAGRATSFWSQPCATATAAVPPADQRSGAGDPRVAAASAQQRTSDDEGAGFWGDPSCDWEGEEGFERQGISMQFESGLVEDEYNRWLRTDARRGGLLQLAFHSMLLIWSVTWHAAGRAPLTWDAVTKMVIFFCGVVVTGIEALLTNRPRCWLSKCVLGAQSLRVPTQAPAEAFADARSTALRHSRILHGALATLNAAAIVLVSCGESFDAFDSAVRRHVGLYICGTQYAVVSLPLYFVCANTVVYTIRWVYSALIASVYAVTFAVSVNVFHNCLDSAQRALLTAAFIGFTAFLTLMGRANERMLRERFEHIIRLQVALRSIQQHEAALLKLLRMIVPEALLPRIRNAETIKSLAVLDHTVCGVVSAAALRDCSATLPTISPSAVIGRICEVFGAFDTMFQELGASSDGFDKLFVTGDMYVACGGLVGQGRRSALVTTHDGKSVENDEEEQIRAAGGCARSADELMKESLVNVSRAIAIALKQASVSINTGSDQPTAVVSTGVGYGECWGGINGEILHTRYMLHGEAFDDAWASCHIGSSGDTYVSARAADALRRAAVEVGEPSADAIVNAHTFTEGAAAGLMLVRPLQHSEAPNATPTHPASTLAPSAVSHESLLEMSLPGSDCDGEHDNGSASSTREMRTDPPQPSDDQEPATEGVRIASPLALASPPIGESDAVGATRRGALLHHASPHPTGQRGTVATAAAGSDRVDVPRQPVDEPSFFMFCRGLDRRNQPSVTVAMSVYLATTVSVFTIERIWFYGPAVGIPSDVTFYGSSFTLALCVAAEHLGLRTGWAPHSRVATALLASLLPLVMVCQLVAARFSVIGASMMTAPAHVSIIVLMRTTSQRAFVRVAQFVTSVAACAGLLLFAWNRTPAEDLGAEWVSLVYLGVAVVLMFTCVASVQARYARRVFVCASLSAECLDRATSRVAVREGLLERLVPRHVLRQISAVSEASEHADAWDREQSAFLERRGQASAAGVAARVHQSEASRALQLIGSTTLRRTVFDQQPRFLERWDSICVTAFRFTVAISSTASPHLGHPAARQETPNTQAAADQCVNAIRCVDAAAAAISPALRVISSIGDTVTVAAFPPTTSRGSDPGVDDRDRGSTLWPVTKSAVMLDRVQRESEVPFTAVVATGVGIGGIVGSKQQYVVAGEAPALAAALLAHCTSPGFAPPTGRRSSSPLSVSVFSTVQARRRLDYELQQQRQALSRGPTSDLTTAVRAASKARSSFDGPHWYAALRGFGRRPILEATASRCDVKGEGAAISWDFDHLPSPRDGSNTRRVTLQTPPAPDHSR